ncbi:unnamed protein product [Linum tenue]|uniref:Uncharacterized protein n=1 Tax=Linum tenue TaxID=586396 RepID=A0AAV0JN05_9ROSI|nr:unnamed protein product [Linum tenue]
MAPPRKKKISGEVIGIDLGTTYSCVAVSRNGKAEIIANDQGNRTTPSSVAFTYADTNSERLIGDAAKNQAALNPRRTIFDAKRLFEDAEVQSDLKYLPYPVVNRNGKPYIEVELKTASAGGKDEAKAFSPEEISAMILGKMKETAESYLGKPIIGAVITVPAYFNDAQRQATKDAGRIAGLNVLRIINEPTAAAIAYGLINKQTKRKRKKDDANDAKDAKSKILVYDLGGGTFDVSVLELDGREFRVLATGGDTHLGGGDFDQRVLDYFMKLIKKKHSRDIGEDNKALGKLRRECERAKRVLSSQSETRIEIDSLFQGMDFSESLTRAKFEELNLDLFNKTLEVVKETMKDAKLEKGEIDEIVLEMFDGKEPSKGVNPDEAVAYGAAVLGAKLKGQAARYDITLFDVTPLSLGVSVVGDLMATVIPRNTTIPAKMSQTLYSIEDRQTTMGFEVLQGERTLAKDCLMLGRCLVGGVPPAPRGVGSIEATFEIDADGILSVTGKNHVTKKSESLVIDTYRGNLTEEEIERMIREAEMMAEEDKRAKARVEAKLNLERYISDVKAAAANRFPTSPAGSLATKASGPSSHSGSHSLLRLHVRPSSPGPPSVWPPPTRLRAPQSLQVCTRAYPHSRIQSAHSSPPRLSLLHSASKIILPPRGFELAPLLHYTSILTIRLHETLVFQWRGVNLKTFRIRPNSRHVPPQKTIVAARIQTSATPMPDMRHYQQSTYAPCDHMTRYSYFNNIPRVDEAQTRGPVSAPPSYFRPASPGTRGPHQPDARIPIASGPLRQGPAAHISQPHFEACSAPHRPNSRPEVAPQTRGPVSAPPSYFRPASPRTRGPHQPTPLRSMLRPTQAQLAARIP